MSITVGSTVRLADGFCNPAERDLRFTVTAIDGSAITATETTSGKVVHLAAQAFTLA